MSLCINSVQKFTQFTQSNEKLNLNSQQPLFPPPQVHNTDIESLRSCCRVGGKKRVQTKFPARIKASLRTTCPTYAGAVYDGRGAAALLFRELSSRATLQSLLSNVALDRAGDRDGAQQGIEQTAGSQVDGKVWPSVTSGDRSSAWRRRGQRTKLKREHVTTTKFLYKQPSSLLQTLNEQELHDVFMK